ncbi:zinc finger protein ZFP2-like [Ochlerotatus camptorhynchus]|uniref:zinc finger protein ZFP2-like n=1 Tax=Ochlerotatus camptorhynchus TaxID=644619 RepID=UPI0031DB9E63
MGRKCCVPKCSSNYDAVLRKGQSTISTFKFPEEKHLRDSWLRALNRGNDWQPGRTASICINHFQPEDIVRYDKPAKLKPEAVPSIFENLSNKGPIVKRGRPRKTETQGNSLGEDEQYEDVLYEEHLEPVDGLMEELILDFDSFSQQISEKLCLERWHHYQNNNVLHFYNIYEHDTDSAIRIDNSIKVYEDMKMKLFLMNVRQADEKLQWILGHDMKICRWSQFETILKKYDSKLHQLREIVQTNNDENSEIHSEEQTEECKGPSPNFDSSVEYLDQQEDEEIEFLAVELANTQDETITSVQSVRNPLRTNKERVVTAQERVERKNVRDVVQKLKNAKHKCFICQQEHESNEDFERHLPEHTVMLPFNCEQYTSQAITIKTLASLNKHFLMHQKPLKCRSCDVRFSTYSTRLLHEQNSHENSGPFTCEICGKISHSLRGHQHHFKVHTNPESMKCQLCGKQLSSGYELKLHMRVHTKEKPNKCPFCPASFNRISNLVVHKRRLHGTEKPFRCASCGEEFRSNVELKRHAMASHDFETPTISKEKSFRKINTASSKDGKRDYHCKACDKQMPNASSYHSHMRKHRKRYQCSYCGLRVGQLRDFIDHENTHTGRRPYECEVCSKTFKTSSTYYGHRAVHTAEKRFNCEVCGRRFNRLRHMVIHARTHAKTSFQKSHACSICSETFPDRNSHSKHVESHNVVQPVENQPNSEENPEPQVIANTGESQLVTLTLAAPVSKPLQLPRIIHTSDGKEAILVTADMISSQNFFILQQSAKDSVDM